MQYYGKTETPYTMDYKPELVYQSKLDAYGLDKPKLQEQELGRWIICRGSHGLLS